MAALVTRTRNLAGGVVVSQLTASNHCRFLVGSGSSGARLQLWLTFTGPRNQDGGSSSIGSQNSGFVHQFQLLLNYKGGGWGKSWNSSRDAPKTDRLCFSLVLCVYHKTCPCFWTSHEIYAYLFRTTAATSGRVVGRRLPMSQRY